MAYTRYDYKENKRVKFDGKDSYTVYGLVFVKAIIGVPQRKTTTVSTILMDGDEDITDSISNPKYSNRKLKFYFTVNEAPESFKAIKRKICSEINGKYFDKTIEYDGSLYTGRAKVNEWESAESTASVVIEFDAKPYCYDVGSEVKRYE